MSKVWVAYYKWVYLDEDEDQTDLLRRCTEKLGSEVVMGEDFNLESMEDKLPI